MLKDCLEVYKSILDEKGEDFLIDAYIPCNGRYVLIDTSLEDFKIQTSFDITMNKKTKELEGKNNTYFNKIKKLDYYSQLMSVQKPIDKYKKIHSNNYLSFFVKKENLIPNKDNEIKLTEEIIDNYYDTLSNPMVKYSSDKKSKEAYKILEEKLGTVDSDLINKIRLWIKDNIYNLDLGEDMSEYIKIFFEAPIEDYIRENNRYLTMKIYNKNEYNEIIDGKLYGLPNDNMTMNSNKPYLEQKTRKNKMPYLIDSDEVLIQKKFFDYLKSQLSYNRCNVYINLDKDKIQSSDKIKCLKNGEMIEEDFRGIYIRTQQSTQVDILDVDYISSYKYKLKKELKYKMYINLDISKLKKESIDLYATTYRNKSQIQNLLSKVYFSDFLKNNYFTELKRIKLKDQVIKKELSFSRKYIFDWIYKEYQQNISTVLEKVSLELIKSSIVKGSNITAINQFNLRWSFIEYFKGEEVMANFLNDVNTKLKNKINSDNMEEIENDLEYYFAIGQVVYYLLSLNKSSKRTQSLANPFINARSDEMLKEKLKSIYKKYNYDIQYNNKRFSNLYRLILGYNPDGKVNQDMIIAGFLSSNLIYEAKKDKEKDKQKDKQ